MNKNFIIIGAAGYIAPRHMKAIKETNNDLIAAYDPYDGIGIIDSYFPDASFFTEFERIDRFVDLLKSEARKSIDYVSICSPNYLHDSHIRFALRNNSHAICEKPLVLNTWNIDRLIKFEKEYNKKVYTILQLRYHPSIIKLKNKVNTVLKTNPNKVFEIDLTYITTRGQWYLYSWKGDASKSGGIATNIGVHFFDMLSWIFGEYTEIKTNIKKEDVNAGILKFKNANVKWFLSINSKHLIQNPVNKDLKTFRSIKVDNQEVEFSDGFTDLHTTSYVDILKGDGFGLEDAKPSIEIVSKIRSSAPLGLKGEYHPFCKLV